MQFENQKDNEQFFIFPIKKIDVLRVKLIFKKNSDARHRNAYLARVKTGKIGGSEPIPRVGTVFQILAFQLSFVNIKFGLRNFSCPKGVNQ